MKTHSAELLASVNEKRSPVVITQNGEPRAVVVDIDSYERAQSALILLKLVAQSEQDIESGRWITHAEMQRKLRQRLKD